MVRQVECKRCGQRFAAGLDECPDCAYPNSRESGATAFRALRRTAVSFLLWTLPVLVLLVFLLPTWLELPGSATFYRVVLIVGLCGVPAAVIIWVVCEVRGGMRLWRCPTCRCWCNFLTNCGICGQGTPGLASVAKWLVVVLAGLLLAIVMLYLVHLSGLDAPSDAAPARRRTPSEREADQ